MLTFSLAEWAAFLTGVRGGEFDVAVDGVEAIGRRFQIAYSASGRSSALTRFA